MSANAPQTTTTTWNFDPAHTTAEFKVRHMMITNVKGQFRPVTGVVTLDEDDITRSRVEASIDAASIDTREPDRDTHLKSADFFDVEKFPTFKFHLDARNSPGGWRTGSGRRFNDTWRNAEGDVRSRRPNAAG